MENYDLLSLYKYTTKATGCGNCTESTDGDVTGQTTPDEDVQYNVVSGDTATIDGKEVDALGTLSDEDVEEGLKAQETKSSITDFGIYKTLGQTLLDKLKKLISWAINGVKPDTTPEEPEDPTEPTDPTTSEDYVEMEDDGTDGVGPTTDWTTETSEDTYLQRGDTAEVNISSENETVLILENPFGGANYQYKLTSTTGAETTATFEFLENGRLVVRGNNIKMIANENQKDDIILLGNNCELDTGDGDDTVRVGYVVDSNPYKMDNTPTTQYLESGSTKYYAATNNIIKTGSGNDYVSILGIGGQVDTGSGGDRVETFLGTTDVNLNINDAEQVYTLKSKTSAVDGYDGWVMQGTEGDCRLLALINSICGNRNNGKLSDYITITKSGTSYKVTFKNYSGTNKTATITENELKSYTGVYGDIDTILIDIALNQLLALNRDYGKTNVSDAYYNTLASYILGTEDCTMISTNWKTNIIDFRTKFMQLWNQYKNGVVPNFTVGIQSTDNRLGIIGGHAYSVRNLTNEYIELINPWDDADCLRLSLDDFFNLSLEAFVYGKDVYGEKMRIPNGGEIEFYSSNNNATNTVYTVGFSGQKPTVTDEIQETKQNIEQIKSLINIAVSKTLKELS